MEEKKGEAEERVKQQERYVKTAGAADHGNR